MDIINWLLKGTWYEITFDLFIFAHLFSHPGESLWEPTKCGENQDKCPTLKYFRILLIKEMYKHILTKQRFKKLKVMNSCQVLWKKGIIFTLDAVARESFIDFELICEWI